jgi:hypothetical protein
MRNLLGVFLTLLCTGICQAQGNINRGDIMLGGSASFSSVSFSGQSGSITVIELSPNVGYFFANGFAGGLLTSVQSLSQPGEPTTSNYSVAPFLRFYFLPPMQKVNVFVQASYGFGSTSVNGQSISSNEYAFAAGPSIFLTPAVALDISVRYASLGYSGSSTRQNTFGAGLGFQVFLH